MLKTLRLAPVRPRFLPEIVPHPTIAPTDKLSKTAIRSSLKASTLDGVFSTMFSCVTAEVLLSNFLLELGATSKEIGMLCAIPMLANFLQPIGAYLADKAESRRFHSWRIFIPSRLLWLLLVVGIIFFNPQWDETSQLIHWTLLIALMAYTVGALGTASWLSWMTVIVPSQLRGRYFGFRNSAASFTNLLCIPLLGWWMSHWRGGVIESYQFLLIFGVVAGLISLGCQFGMVDVNPLLGKVEETDLNEEKQDSPSLLSCFKDGNYRRFLLYFGLWMFAVNLSAPFFNIYLLKDLGLDVSRVTLYGSLTAGANLLMLVRWGKLADKIGNRAVLIPVGLVVAVTPLFWTFTRENSFSLWLWIPLLYLLLGATWSAVDLCNNNLQMTIASSTQPSSYFAIAAATGGLGSALGTTTGGFIAELDHFGGFPGLFALSAVVRLFALLPLAFVREGGS